MRAIDCMTFAGGFTLGMIDAGFTITAKREYPGDFARPLYEANITVDDTQYAAPEDWKLAETDAEIVFGNPPCSGFSIMSTTVPGRADLRGIDSPVNACMWAFAKYVAHVRPQVAIFESVRAAGRMGLPLMRDLHGLLEHRTGRPWHLTHLFHSNSALGGYQQRDRYFWIASQETFTIELPVPPDPRRTVRDAIGDLEHTPLGSIDGHVTLRGAVTARTALIATLADWRPGEYSGHAVQRATDNGIDLGDLSNTDRSTHRFAPKRIEWDKPSPVIMGRSLEDVVHPSQPRTVTYREIARLMGYPDTWTCQPSIDAGYGGITWWGKGIPVGTARWIGTQLARHLDGSSGTHTGTSIGPRERVIDIERTIKDRATDQIPGQLALLH